MESLENSTLSDKEMEELIGRMIEVSKRHGAKVTTQRILIFKELARRTKEHPSAEELFEGLKGKVYGLSLSTVYRTLATFESLGLVRRIPTPDGKAHYEIAGKPHGHFICQKCGGVFDLDDETLPTDEIKSKINSEGFEVKGCNLVCYGLCPSCRS